MSRAEIETQLQSSLNDLASGPDAKITAHTAERAKRIFGAIADVVACGEEQEDDMGFWRTLYEKFMTFAGQRMFSVKTDSGGAVALVLLWWPDRLTVWIAPDEQIVLFDDDLLRGYHSRATCNADDTLGAAATRLLGGRTP